VENPIGVEVLPKLPTMIVKEHHAPNIDVVRMAKEIKSFIDKNKFDHVDYDLKEIEMYPDPRTDLRFPTLKKFFRWLLWRPPGLVEFCKFCSQWEAMFDYADKITQDDGTGFPKEDAKAFEDMLAEVEKEVNNDDEFWKKIKDEVLPIYSHSKDETWKKRWAKVHLFYDPVGITVTTHKKMVNKLTGEVTKRELVRQREIPAGIVVKIL